MLGMFFQQTGALADAEKLRRKLLEQAQTSMPEGHINIAKIAWDLGETLAARKRDAELIVFYAEWLPQWDAKFPEGDSRRTDAHKWHAEAQQRLATANAAR